MKCTYGTHYMKQTLMKIFGLTLTSFQRTPWWLRKMGNKLSSYLTWKRQMNRLKSIWSLQTGYLPFGVLPKVGLQIVSLTQSMTYNFSIVTLIFWFFFLNFLLLFSFYGFLLLLYWGIQHRSEIYISRRSFSPWEIGTLILCLRNSYI